MGWYDDSVNPEPEEEPSDVEEFFTKMDHEGGVSGALDYGLTSSMYPDIPDEMARDWDMVRDSWDEFDANASEFMSKWDRASQQ